MAGRERSHRPARPGGRAGLIELGKDLLIAALACSAVFLAAQTPMVSELKGWMAQPVETAEPETRQPDQAVKPYLLAVRSERGLYGVSYDEEQVSQTFERLSPYLGEGFATAGTAEVITQRRWQALLESPGVYCAFQGQPPLAVLSAWLGSGTGTSTGNVQSALLAWDGSVVWLCWREQDGYRAARTQVAWQGHLEAALGEFNPNGAAFAYTLAENDRLYHDLDPDVLVSMTTYQPRVYSASSPDFTADREALDQLLGYLGFQSGGSSAYEAAGNLVINEGGDRLQVSPTGTVTFHAGEENRYPVASAGTNPTVEEAAQAAWDLLNRAAGGWKGDGTFLLTGAEAAGTDGWTVTFRYRLDGVPVLVGETGWAARFTIKDRGIADFTLALRTYSDTGSTSVVPRERLAAAALTSLDSQGGRLTLCYSDGGATSVAAGWVAES